MDCRARHKRQLDFAFNASFASLNVAKVFMKDNGMDNLVLLWHTHLSYQHASHIECLANEDRQVVGLLLCFRCAYGEPKDHHAFVLSEWLHHY